MHQQLIDLKNIFPDYEIYLWSNYGFNETSDIDLKFVGHVTPDLGEKLFDIFMEYRQYYKPYFLDPTMYEDTKLFEHIPRFNRCKDDIYYFDEEIIRYKCWPQKNNHYHGREVEQLDEHLYKVKQIFARKDGKYKNRDWTYPMLLNNYEKFINFSHT